MGVSFHEMWFLVAAANAASLGDVLTFGRQHLNVSRRTLARQLKCDLVPQDDIFAEDFMCKHLGARSVSSIDYSDFEGATYTADLNSKIDIGRQFDTIVDFGTTEHVFDVAAVLRNAIDLCKVGGRILHALPSNSDCGHGFYQFSPELFFSLYNWKNGFCDTEIYIAEAMNEKYWWKALQPRPGQRLAVNSLSTTYLLSRTTKVQHTPHLSVQQSDYEHAWHCGSAPRGAAAFLDSARGLLKGSFAAHIATIGYRTYLARTGLTRFNPHLKKVCIPSIALPDVWKDTTL